MVVTTRRSLLFLLFAASLAQATTLLALDVPSLTRSSQAVVRGTVKASTARWTADHSRIMTDTVIEVRETWKGAPVSTLTVMQPGGVVGDVGQQVHGTVKLPEGQEVVLFLEARGAKFLLTGMVQGLFVIEGGVARQALENQALFLDPATHQPVVPTSIALPIEALHGQVAAAAGVVAPVEPTRPPVKVTP